MGENLISNGMARGRKVAIYQQKKESNDFDSRGAFHRCLPVRQTLVPDVQGLQRRQRNNRDCSSAFNCRGCQSVWRTIDERTGPGQHPFCRAVVNRSARFCLICAKQAITVPQTINEFPVRSAPLGDRSSWPETPAAPSVSPSHEMCSASRQVTQIQAGASAEDTFQTACTVLRFAETKKCLPYSAGENMENAPSLKRSPRLMRVASRFLTKSSQRFRTQKF